MSTNNVCDILIVEDDPVQCEEMSAFLARSGLGIVTSPNGRSALDRAAALSPRVVLIDFDLPDTTGVQLAHELRKILPHASILVMSGRVDGLSEKTLEKSDITVFLNKPVPLRVLREAVLKLARPTPNQLPAGRARQRGWLSAGLGGTRH
jgi:DNA-binding NtrC family response regulator